MQLNNLLVPMKGQNSALSLPILQRRQSNVDNAAVIQSVADYYVCIISSQLSSAAEALGKSRIPPVRSFLCEKLFNCWTANAISTRF